MRCRRPSRRVPRTSDSRCRPVGGFAERLMTAALRGPQSVTNRRYASASRLPQACSIETHVRSRSRWNTIAGAVRARRRRGECPRITVHIPQTVGGEIEFLHDSGVPDHDVGRRPAVHRVAGKPFDGGHGAARHGVAFEHLDGPALSGQITRRHQRVVSRADDEGVQNLRHEGPVEAGGARCGSSGSVRPRTANGRRRR